MQLCIFNPEHDLCLASGRALYIPPRSAVDFARRDAHLMQALYPEAHCCSVYDLNLSTLHSPLSSLTVWGWNAVVKHELQKRGVPFELLPTDDAIATIRRLQHRSTILPLQPDCHAIYNIVEMEALLRERDHWVLKAPWSGAGRGLRWVHGSLSEIDRNWIAKVVKNQRCVIAEPNRMWDGDWNGASPHPVADLALEYMDGIFFGYSYFKTGSGVYKENVMWTDERIEAAFPAMRKVRGCIGPWLDEHIWPHYRGPLGVDLMVCADGSLHVAELNLRHTMGMVAHEKLRVKSYEL